MEMDAAVSARLNPYLYAPMIQPMAIVLATFLKTLSACLPPLKSTLAIALYSNFKSSQISQYPTAILPIF